MTLERAIEILRYKVTVDTYIDPELDQKAIKLGIEALKRLQDMRTSPCTTADEILLDETER